MIDLIRGNGRVISLLEAVRATGVEEWCIAAGTIRNLVWDHVHGHETDTEPGDVDVLVYEPNPLSKSFESDIQTELNERMPGIEWEVVNQATIHTYTGDPAPYRSIEHAMSRWAEQATAVGAHLDAAGVITVVAPSGLDDLFDLRVRPNLVTPTAAEVYRHRTTSKGWAERWPMLCIEQLPSERADNG